MHRPVADALASVIDASSVVGSGWTLTFYSLADVLQEVYTDTDWVTPASTAGVLTANSSGRFPKAFFKDDLDYKAILKDDDGATVTTINPIFKAAGYLDASDLTPYLLKAGGDMTGPLNMAEGAAVASAATINLNSATGNFLHVTGTTGISAVTLQQGALRWVVFDGALTLTHSSNLILPGSLNITTVAGDCALFVGEGSGVTRLLWYRCVDGKALIENGDYQFAGSDESTNLTTGTAKITFRMPWTIYLDQNPIASLSVAQTGGSILAFDINVGGASIFSTTLTIDNNELDSSTAATAAVLSTTSIAAGSTVTFDIDTVGTAGARGAKVLLRGYRRNR